MEISDNIKIGRDYVVTVMGYDYPGYVFVQFDKRHTGYLDVSEFNYTEQELYSTFKVNQQVHVYATKIDTTTGIICELIKEEDTEKKSNRKSSRKKNSKPKNDKHNDSDDLTYSLEGILSKVNFKEK